MAHQLAGAVQVIKRVVFKAAAYVELKPGSLHGDSKGARHRAGWQIAVGQAMTERRKSPIFESLLTVSDIDMLIMVWLSKRVCCRYV